MILASKSPRRREILEEFGFKLHIVSPEIDEVSEESDITLSIMDIAHKKAQEVAKEFPNEYVLAADTVVVINGCVLGKPKDRADAENMLLLLSGKEHTVITGYSLINSSKNFNLTLSDSAKVKFRELSREIIQWYLDSGEPFDKAGSYGIQKLGNILVESITGDFFTIMGFPLSHFINSLISSGMKLEEILEL